VASAPTIAPGKRFDTLTAALSHLRSHFPKTHFRGMAKSPETGEQVEFDIPRWLYRGEGGFWATTTSSLERIRRRQHHVFTKMPADRQPGFVRKVEEISRRAIAELVDFLDIDLLTAEGTAQHYELPTDFIDFSWSLDVALAFAVGRASTWQGPQSIRFAVLDMTLAARNSVVADLAELAGYGRRPVIQEAYAVKHRTLRDFKNPTCVAALGLRWFDVTTTPAEALTHAATTDLMDAHLDQAAGALQLVLDGMAKTDGKWPDVVAKYLADTVAAAPFVTKVVESKSGRPAVVELAPASSLGYRFDEAKARAESHKLWSRTYTDFTHREY
jgi:hypothetical protein